MSYLPTSKQDKSNRWNSFVADAERYTRLYDVRRTASHGLRVLAFVARSDGSIVDAERLVICCYVHDAARIVGETLSEDDCNEIASDIETLFPTKRQVANSLDAIRLYHEQIVIFMDSLKALVRSDAIITPREQDAVQMLVEILRRQKDARR